MLAKVCVPIFILIHDRLLSYSPPRTRRSSRYNVVEPKHMTQAVLPGVSFFLLSFTQVGETGADNDIENEITLLL